MAFYGSNKDEFVTSLAALALYDGGAEITASNINVLLSGSNNKVQPYWPGLFASLLSNRINDLLYSVGGGGGGGGVSSAAASASSAPAGDAKAAEKPKEEKPKEEVVDALDGGMDMFGGGGGGGGDY